jgi:hypothetical protein
MELKKIIKEIGGYRLEAVKHISSEEDLNSSDCELNLYVNDKFVADISEVLWESAFLAIAENIDWYEIYSDEKFNDDEEDNTDY